MVGCGHILSLALSWLRGERRRANFRNVNTGATISVNNSHVAGIPATTNGCAAANTSTKVDSAKVNIRGAVSARDPGVLGEVITQLNHDNIKKLDLMSVEVSDVET